MKAGTSRITLGGRELVGVLISCPFSSVIASFHEGASLCNAASISGSRYFQYFAEAAGLPTPPRGSEFVVQPSTHRIYCQRYVGPALGNWGRHRNGAQIEVQVLDSGSPILHDAPFDPTASGPSGAGRRRRFHCSGRRVSAGTRELGSGQVFFSPGEAARAVEQPVVPSVPHAATHRAK